RGNMSTSTRVNPTINIFAPAIRIMHRLRYPQKFALVGFLLLLPLVFLLSQYLAGINADIEFAEKEQRGLAYNAPVVNLLHSLQRYGVLSLTPSLQDIRSREQSQLESAISAVDSINRTFGAQFEVDDDWEQFKAAWESLKNDLPTLTTEEIAQRYSTLSENL